MVKRPLLKSLADVESLWGSDVGGIMQNATVACGAPDTARFRFEIGDITVAALGGALCGLWLGGGGPAVCPDAPVPESLRAVQEWLGRYFAGEQPETATLRLSPDGTAFQKTVWQELRAVPYGTVLSYGELSVRVARRLGCARMSAQAVGTALGHNRIPVILPCHRIIAKDGTLGGFSAGLEKKRWLLLHEGVKLSDMQ